MLDVEWFDFYADRAPARGMRRGKLLQIGGAVLDNTNQRVAYVLTHLMRHDPSPQGLSQVGKSLIITCVPLDKITVLGEHIPLFEPGEIT